MPKAVFLEFWVSLGLPGGFLRFLGLPGGFLGLPWLSEASLAPTRVSEASGALLASGFKPPL